MSETLNRYLAIDIGGTHVKSGLVTSHCDLENFHSAHTSEWRDGNDFLNSLISHIRGIISNNPKLENCVGVGIPGLVDQDRRKVLEVPSIPELNGVPLKETLESAFPGFTFFLENDANAAALGEHYFKIKNKSASFIFVTLGTGVGGAALINGKYFAGGNGNPVELGHMISRGGQQLEHLIGKMGILKMATDVNRGVGLDKSHRLTVPISIPTLIQEADSGMIGAKEVFNKCGKILGEGLVNVIRILDINQIIVGGGISVAYKYILPGIMDSFNNHLTPYYLNSMTINKAELGNDAGLLGAAVPCFKSGD